MVSTTQNQFVYDVKVSSAVPGSISGEDKVYGFKDMDLVMKLHHLRGVYLFSKDAAEGLNIGDMKSPMFRILELYYPLAGRIRRPEPEDGRTGRPFIKCNDGGVRIVEAKCNKTIDEWLQLRAAANSDDSAVNYNDNQLVYSQVLGPDLGFSPLVFIQFTWFKCGGISIGLSWAHVLGDAFAASNFINLWGQLMAGNQVAYKHLSMPGNNNNNNGIHKSQLSSAAKIPFSIKTVDPVGDHWLTPNDCKMQIHSINLTAEQLNHLLSKSRVKPFELVSALLWKSLAKIRGDQSEPKAVTICRNDPSCDRKNELLCNSQVISTVEATDLKVADADLLELAALIAQKQMDERSMIEELMERDEGKSDFIVYGGNLTFVDLEDANIYSMELRGQKPVFANYTLTGVGDEGAILVLPDGPASEKEQIGRRVNLILPEDQIADLKDELRKEWGIF